MTGPELRIEAVFLPAKPSGEDPLGQRGYIGIKVNGGLLQLVIDDNTERAIEAMRAENEAEAEAHAGAGDPHDPAEHEHDGPGEVDVGVHGGAAFRGPIDPERAALDALKRVGEVHAPCDGDVFDGAGRSLAHSAGDASAAVLRYQQPRRTRCGYRSVQLNACIPPKLPPMTAAKV